MKRFAVLSLVIFLQMQSAWALGQAYSSHSNDSPALHVAGTAAHECHHTHGINNDALTPDTASDNHCSVCHTACLSVLLFSQPSNLADKASQKAKPTQAALHTDALVDSIERPIWRRTI